MDIADARAAAPTLAGAGFTLVPHRSAVADFADRTAVEATYRAEIVALVTALSGADLVLVNSPGIRRFSERSALSGSLDNSRPARFAHVDISDPTAAAFAQRAAPPGRRLRASRTTTSGVRCLRPQDACAAVCDARTVSAADLVAADAVFDAPGEPEWSFECLVLRVRPRIAGTGSRICTPRALVFTTHDSAPGRAHCVPHGLRQSRLRVEWAPRVSIEMRALALWLRERRLVKADPAHDHRRKCQGGWAS
jgi:hypothetical protein